MPRPDRTLLARAAIVVVVAAIALVLALRGGAGATATTVSTAPTAWSLPRLVGSGTVSLASLRGHPVVVDFYASWCTACRGELPELARVADSLRGRVTFVAVDSEETGDGLAMARSSGVGSWTLLADSGGGNGGSGLHDALGEAGMPVAAFYSSDGRLLAVVPGALDAGALRARLESLFGVS